MSGCESSRATSQGREEADLAHRGRVKLRPGRREVQINNIAQAAGLRHRFPVGLEPAGSAAIAGPRIAINVTMERLIVVSQEKAPPQMKSHRTEQRLQPRPCWKSLEQLADFWGLSRARTNLVVQALVRSGRMEERRRRDDRPPHREFRLINS